MRAGAEGLHIAFREADAEVLPFADAAFDAVASTFGVMLAPDQARAAAEMLRVCRPGGHIGLANWTPDSFIGELFRVLGGHLPPPAGVKPPSLWGDRAWIEQAFGPSAAALSFQVRSFMFRYATPQEGVDEFRRFYRPIHRAFGALDARGQEALEGDLLATIARFNAARDGAMRVPSVYAEIVIVKA